MCVDFGGSDTRDQALGRDTGLVTSPLGTIRVFRRVSPGKPMESFEKVSPVGPPTNKINDLAGRLATLAAAISDSQFEQLATLDRLGLEGGKGGGIRRAHRPHGDFMIAHDGMEQLSILQRRE